MPNKHKKDIGIEVLVGLFMFIVLIALGVFTIVLSRQNFWQEKHPIVIHFEEVSGLRDGDHVFLRGMKVGVVKKTYLENNHVVVTSDLDVPVDFHEGYKVEVVSSSMLGGKILRLNEGPLYAPRISEGEQIIGTPPVDILEELGEAVASLRQISENVAAGEGTLGKLLQDDTMYQDATEMMTNLKEVSTRLSNGEGTLGKLLDKNDQFYADLQASAENIRGVSERLAAGEGTLGKLLSKDDVVYDDILATTENLRTISQKIASGEGTLGRLVEDDEIYVEAQKLLIELRAAIDDMRETSPVTTFSTVLFGAF